MSYKTKDTFNTRQYHSVINDIVDNVHDYHFVANEMSKLYKELDKFGCVDSTRASKVGEDGCWSGSFESKISCCGVSNIKVKNEKTGSEFWIGFNFGH